MKRKKVVEESEKSPTFLDVQQRGLAALARELGPEGLIKFFQLYGLGEGDYTRDRHKWLDGLTVREIARRAGIKKKPS